MRAKFVSAEMKKAQAAATKAAMEKFAAEGNKVTRVMEGVGKRQVNRALLDAGLAYESKSFGKTIVEVNSDAKAEEVRSVVEQLSAPIQAVRTLMYSGDALDTARRAMNV